VIPKPAQSCVVALPMDLGSGRRCHVLCQRGTLHFSVGEGPGSILVVQVGSVIATWPHCDASCRVRGCARGSFFLEAS
jgi:hypothetical protein